MIFSSFSGDNFLACIRCRSGGYFAGLPRGMDNQHRIRSRMPFAAPRLCVGAFLFDFAMSILLSDKLKKAQSAFFTNCAFHRRKNHAGLDLELHMGIQSQQDIRIDVQAQFAPTDTLQITVLLVLISLFMVAPPCHTNHMFIICIIARFVAVV
jgi:hypothetical protein